LVLKNKKSKRIVKENKKAIAMPFEWIFAMIIGGIILFIAIYAVVHFMSTGQAQSNTKTAAELEGYLSPYETGLGSGISDEIHFSAQSKLIFEQCEANNNKPFGMQSFAFTEKMFGKYGKESNKINIYSKYIFTNESVEGKDFYIVSVPYSMSYKISDLILIYSGKYCFYNAPEEIEDFSDSLQLKNVNFSGPDNPNCTGIHVCFNSNSEKCDIKVSGECLGDCESDYDYGKVEKYDKNGKLVSTVYYSGNLLYGAIFSSNHIYECNVIRLMNKFNELGKVYLDKIKIIESKGCSSNVELKLNTAMEMANNLQSSQGLINLYSQIKDIQNMNGATTLACRLYVNEDI
jgi:hypothetical protein